MRFSSRVCDSTSGFATRAAIEPEATTLIELIDTVLGAKFGQLVLQQLGGEFSTSANLYSRLRTFLKASTSAELLGLSEKRMAKLLAAVELGKRMYCVAPPKGEIIDDPAVAAQALQPIIGYEPVEKFAVILLDIKHRLLSVEIVSSGIVNETCVHPRELFRAVILGGGSRCIIAHNHPSGSVEPSEQDLTITSAMLKAAQQMMMPILDHLIVSHGNYCSLRQTTGLWQEVPQNDQ
ncbi:MAG: DNA repair protein RadC [Pegethrix bostrychoides GSE-TBD4-15B]|jgi:DNA repair protein RadC|uniref:DNA repair protein RadC n=1 Tax=Pegethrix bostrychoides GSE-TBD4-15B TaxID=2839662 RepID=A0A951U5L2_9CYAN|nr:DNA repair protein RadC [Pegethrix bostrychoides GSE-TBD4-15B]